MRIRPGPLAFAIIPVCALLVIWGSLQYSAADNFAVLAQTAGKKVVDAAAKIKNGFNVSASDESIASLFKSMEEKNAALEKKDVLLNVKVKKLVSQVWTKVPTSRPPVSIHLTARGTNDIT